MKTALQNHIFSFKRYFNMSGISFANLPTDIHQCTSHRQGDWITWRCPHCNSYERRYNFVTGEMQIKRGNSTAQHTGASTRAENMEALQQVLSFN
ncbi:MAG: hypothetical protein ABIQ93_09545 [Saprospiraceae bacterium]